MKPDPDFDHPTPGMAVWGWMTPVELDWLRETAAGMGSVTEIGSLHGRSAVALLTGCAAGPVYCIDPWDDVKDECYGSFLNATAAFPNVVPHRGFSVPAALELPDVDMTFIDGAHAYEAVLADIAAWLPKTRKLICGHDYCNEDAGYPGVAQAVNAVFGDRVVVPEGTSIWTVDLELARHVEAEAPAGVMEYVDEYGRGGAVEINWPEA